VATGKDEDVFAQADEVTTELERRGVSVLYDDRRKVSPGVKFKDAELVGVPTIVVIGRNLAEGVIEVRDRRSGAKRDVAVAEAVDAIVDEVRGTSAS
jgi:prolyl-tRNA synthetase